MRVVLLTAIIFMFTAGFSVADSTGKSTGSEQGFKRAKVSKLRGGKFTRIFMNTSIKVQKLYLDKKTEKKASKVIKYYGTSIMKEEQKSNALQREFMRQLKSDDFDPQKMLDVYNAIQKANKKAAKDFIEGLVKLKAVIGPKNFAKMIPLTKVDRNVLVQLREGYAKDPIESFQQENNETQENPDVNK